MTNLKRFQKSSEPPSRRSLEKAALRINGNLVEMRIIKDSISGSSRQLSGADKHHLLFLGSCLYDFYLLAEDSLLQIARIIDRWMPASLDWHERLIKLMQSPVPEKRPPVISAVTASLMAEYLTLYLNFHQHSSRLKSARIERMVGNLDLLCKQLEKELTAITRLIVEKK